MNFKAIGLKMAVATAVVAGTTMTSAPAQAYDLYSRTLAFDGSAYFNPKNRFFDFKDDARIVGGGTGDLETFGAVGTNLTIKDLTLELTGTDTWSLTSGPVDEFITGLDNDITFRLDSFILTKIQSVKVGNNFNDFYDAVVTGVFFSPKFADGVATESGDIFQIQIRGNELSGSYIGQISTIPTPALLPGLLGMGIAALRKRKGEESAEAEA